MSGRPTVVAADGGYQAVIRARMNCTIRVSITAGCPRLSFEVKLVLECIVTDLTICHRFDDLLEWLDEPGTGPLGFAFPGRAKPVNAAVGQVTSKRAP
jgi:hypothetical protein